MKVKSWVLLAFFFVVLLQNTDCQVQILNNSYGISWTSPLVYGGNLSSQQTLLHFDGAVDGEEFPTLPYWMEKLTVDNFYTDYEVRFSNISYEIMTFEEEKLIPELYPADSILRPIVKTVVEKKAPQAFVSFVPIVKMADGHWAKVISFDMSLSAKFIAVKSKGEHKYALHSVLNQGSWYKIAVAKSGIYKVTYSDMVKLGMPMQNVSSSRLSLFGNGGGRLPETCGEYSYDDLLENAIDIHDGGDGIFNEGDYFLFYAQGPHTWKYDGDKFIHNYNIYDDFAYYYLTIDQCVGLRVEGVDFSAYEADDLVTEFSYYEFYERDGFNFGESGQRWYCDTFDLKSSRSYKFAMPPVLENSPMRVSVSGAASSSATSSFQITADGQNVGSLHFRATNGDYMAMPASTDITFVPKSTPTEISLTYSKPTSSSAAYLDWIELEAKCKLQMYSGQFPFCAPQSVADGRVSAFNISSSNASTQVWNVTDPLHPVKMTGRLQNSVFSFTVPTDSLKYFVAFNGNLFYSPVLKGKIANQDLHATEKVDMIIVAHPDFVSQAERLAEFRADNDNLSVKVVTTQQIYNEFSSGACDVSAIRDYVKMIYDRTEGVYPKYLLLFGRPSYDYRGRVAGTNMKVPNYQSNSVPVETDFRANDDFFGILDDGEGARSEGMVDVAVGRFPVTTESQAKVAVDKVIQYATKQNLVPSGDNVTVSNLADWRNVMTFVADDEDGTTHISTADEIAQIVAARYPTANLDKIYFDAYEQVSHSAAQRYPEVNSAINSRMQKGSLVFTYVGHGGKDGWATERVIERSDINSWSNQYNQPLMLTLTCEFGWYDRQAISPAELCFLNSKGGVSAMVTTSRVAFTYNNDQYGKAFFRKMFEKSNGEHYSIGELNRMAKNACGGAGSGLNMIYMMGDPSQKLVFPEYIVVTDSVNGQLASDLTDTVKALSKVIVKGHIEDVYGNIVTDFNGNVYPSVYDKKQKVRTLQNDEGSDLYEFELQKNLLFKGNSPVESGCFEFSFYVPKDINYTYGLGKISYYACSDRSDASGCYEQMVIGGISAETIADEDGPVLDLYMNNESFVDGGTTNQNPILLVKLKDNYGINTTGNGLGHDLVAFLDENSEKFLLNDYYESIQGSANEGQVRYPLYDLEIGHHAITVRAWDILNNVTESTLNFMVVSDVKLAVDMLLCYPNPLVDHTSFVFEHNRSEDEFLVTLQIYNMMGQKVKTIETTQNSGGFRSDPITWDGRAEDGSMLGHGVYVYQLKICNQSGECAEKSEKVIVL